MKASEFLNLVGEMRKEQKLFFATRREFAREKQEHLIASKALEKQVDRVVAEGRLEPDETTVTNEPTEEQLQLDLDHAIAAGRILYEPDVADMIERLR